MGRKSSESQDLPYGSVDELIDRARASSLQRAIQRIEDGTASDGLLQMFCKGLLPEQQIDNSTKQKNLELMDAKIDKYRSEITSEQMWSEAMVAFARYSGNAEEIVEDDEEMI